MRIFGKLLLTTVLSTTSVGYACAEDYRLGSQDKISISTYEYPNLSGIFVVGPSGGIGAPLIGNVDVNGRSAEEAGNLIGLALARAEKLSDPPNVTVQIVEFRPYYVVGNVERPGRYSYEPGLTVLKALGTAGGTFRPNDSDFLRLGRDAVNADGMIQTQQISASQLRLRIERLKAERNGLPEFTPVLDDKAVNDGADMLKSFAQQERMIFDAKRKLMTGQVDALGKLAAVYRAEVVSLRERVRLKGIEVKTTQARLDREDKLAKMGATASSITLERERLLADIRGEEEELLSLVLRAEQGVTQSEQSLRNLLDSRERDDAQELHDAEVELFQTQVKIKTANALLNEALVLAPDAYRQRAWEQRQTLSYRIIRTVGGQPVELSASESDYVLAGDVVKVSSSEIPLQ